MINSTTYFAFLYSLVALWAAAIVMLLVLGVRRRRVLLVVLGLALAWTGPAAMFWVEGMLSG